jgi:hypothetical protein
VIWATDHNAHVILMAFSNPGFSQSLQEAIDYAWAHNVVLVAAAGNDATGDPAFPAGDKGVIGVSATDQNDDLASTSNFGKSVFPGRAGVDISGTYKDHGYVMWSGTSASGAIVAGRALMHAVDPTLSNGVSLIVLHERRILPARRNKRKRSRECGARAGGYEHGRDQTERCGSGRRWRTVCGTIQDRRQSAFN